jgi:hypothetical protein
LSKKRYFQGFAFFLKFKDCGQDLGESKFKFVTFFLKAQQNVLHRFSVAAELGVAVCV